MQNTTLLFDEIVRLAKRLPPQERIRLAEQIAPKISHDTKELTTPRRRSLRGTWRKVEITEDDIMAARQELWGTFPRGDF